MRQAIVTRFLPPTGPRGSRVTARCAAGRLTLSWDHALNSDQNHTDAALALAERLGWTYPGHGWVGGGLPDGAGYAFVLAAVRS